MIRYSTTTNSSGSYSISGIGQETYLMRIFKSGYITYEQTHSILSASYTLSVQLSPTLAAGEWIRLILSWGATPRDLDFHIRLPNGKIVNYANRTDSSLTLDRDVTSGYGPETMTLYNVAQIGTYLVYINRFSSDNNLANAVAKIVSYASDGRIFSWDIPTSPNNSSVKIWYVCKITINSNKTFSVQGVNTLTTTAPTS